MVSSLAGFVVFIVIVLLAVQVLFDLYARSAVTAAAFDAARRVAGFDVIALPATQVAAAQLDAEAQARRTLGAYGRSVRFTWTITSAEIDLRVQVTNPSLLPAGLNRGLGIDTIDRTVRVRAERLVCQAPAPCQPDGSTVPTTASP